MKLLINVLRFADDMVLVADSAESLPVNLKELDETLTKWERKMNWEKTEVMKVGRERGHCCVEVEDRKLESVEVAKYLGIMMSGDGRMEEEIRSRIGKAARVIEVLNEPVWKQKELSRKTKMKVYNASVWKRNVGTKQTSGASNTGNRNEGVEVNSREEKGGQGEKCRD